MCIIVLIFSSRCFNHKQLRCSRGKRLLFTLEFIFLGHNPDKIVQYNENTKTCKYNIITLSSLLHIHYTSPSQFPRIQIPLGHTGWICETKGQMVLAISTALLQVFNCKVFLVSLMIRAWFAFYRTQVRSLQLPCLVRHSQSQSS